MAMLRAAHCTLPCPFRASSESDEDIFKKIHDMLRAETGSIVDVYEIAVRFKHAPHIIEVFRMTGPVSSEGWSGGDAIQPKVAVLFTFSCGLVGMRMGLCAVFLWGPSVSIYLNRTH